jgi:myotubularin-related protein 6/7/8
MDSNLADQSIRAEFANPDYDAELNDHVKGKERLLLPNLQQIKWWHEVFNRTDEEMNAPAPSPATRELNDSAAENPGLATRIETARTSVDVTPPSSRSPFEQMNDPPSASRVISHGNAGAFASLRDGIAGLGIGRGTGPGSGNKSPASGKQPMEVEMQ